MIAEMSMSFSHKVAEFCAPEQNPQQLLANQAS
jgi:hypothetical protein